MRRFILPTILLIMFLCGGTSQNIPQPKFIIYCLSLIIIPLALLDSLKVKVVTHSERSIWTMAFLFISICILQLIWLPPSVWSLLPGRDIIMTGYELTGLELPWLPISMTPEITLYSLLDFLPPIAVFTYILSFASVKEINTSIYCLMGISILFAVLGFAQTLSGSQSLYPYSVSNFGRPTAFFTNTNHFATLLLMTMCFSLHFMAIDHGSGMSSIILRKTPNFILFGGCTIFLMLGVISTKSLAGIGILAVLLSAHLAIYGRLTWLKSSNNILRFSISILIFAIVIFLILDVFLKGNLLVDVFDIIKGESDFSRKKIYPEVLKLIPTYLPFGAGLGSFEQIYSVDRSLEQTIGQFVNHAHNDYLELFVEFGLFAFLFIGLFLKWWLQAWKSTFALMTKFYGQFYSLRVPALLAIGVFLMHSIVDYPARTITITCFIAYCLGIICKTERQQIPTQGSAVKPKSKVSIAL